MNMLEHYIKSIRSERQFVCDRTGDSLTEVVVTVNCYGHDEKEENVYPTDMWEEIKQKGYYMA